MAKAQIAGFDKLTETISLCRPTLIDANIASLSSATAPDLIVFCAWMSAAPKHIAKYTSGYQRLFPETTILLIEARMVDMFIGNDPTPASEVIASYLKTDQSPRPSIALHASSNGGANNAATLVTHLAEQGYPAPFTSVTMDCSPGKAEPHSAAAAMRLSMPKMLWGEAISTALIYMFVYMYKLYVESLGKQDRIAVIRDTLNDPVMMGKGIRRLYLYSKIDPLVDLEHVREHAEEARTKCGAVVEEEVFVKAPHCALVNEDAGRYWAAVEANASNRGEPLQNPVEQSES